MNPNYRYD
jgi:hypothetical protein